jgi:hypothetical protein
MGNGKKRQTSDDAKPRNVERWKHQMNVIDCRHENWGNLWFMVKTSIMKDSGWGDDGQETVRYIPTCGNACIFLDTLHEMRCITTPNPKRERGVLGWICATAQASAGSVMPCSVMPMSR